MVYQAVDSFNIVNSLKSVGLIDTNAPIKVSKRRSGTQDTTHLLRVPFGDVVNLFDSLIQPELLLWNSYRGETAFSAKLGFFRFVCANGMAVGSTFEGADIKLKHIQGPKWENSFNEFFNNIETMRDQGVKKIEELSSQQLTREQMEKFASRFPDSVKHAMIQDFDKRVEDSTSNVWQLWNVANETLKAKSRSEIAFEQRNDKLLGQILEFAKAA